MIGDVNITKNMNDNQALKLVPHCRKALVPVARPSTITGKYDVGYQWAAVAPDGSVLSGELVLPADTSSVSANAFKATLDALDDMFGCIAGATAGQLISAGVTASVPSQTAAARPAVQPSGQSVTQPATQVAVAADQPAPRRRGRPPGSAAAQPAVATQVVPQSEPSPEPSSTDPESSSGDDFEPVPGNLEPDEPRGKSGRTLSELMNLRILIGKAGGTMRGSTYAAFQKLSEEKNANKNVDNVLDYIIQNEFKAGDGMHDPATLMQCVQEAIELRDLRQRLGIYKPIPSSKPSVK